MLRIIDTHLHLWDLTQFSLPWLDQVPQLNRAYAWPDYLGAQPGENRWSIKHAIYIEVDAAPRQRRQEERYIAQLCRDGTNAIAGGIVALDLTIAGSVRLWIGTGPAPEVKGVRHVLHVAHSPRGACLQRAFIDNVRSLGDRGLLFEACLRCEELADLVQLARLCPQTQFVLNHMGNVDADIIASSRPTLGQRHYQTQWFKDMEQLAAANNVCCKISGVNIARPENKENIAPVLDHSFGAFGEDKIIFGSNYPVCNLNIGLAPWIDTLINYTKSQSPSLVNNLFFNNAKRIYQL